MIADADTMRRIVMGAARLSGLDRLARPLMGGIGAILMLHRVSACAQDSRSPNRHLVVSPEFLDAAITSMKGDGWAFVSMDEALERLRAGDTGQRFAAITADDGYRDNLIEALPVLERHDAPVTIFIAPALIDRTVPIWWLALEDIARTGASVPLVSPAGKLSGVAETADVRVLVRFLSEEVEESRQSEILTTWSKQAGTDPFQPGRNLLMDWSEVKAAANHPLVTIGAHSVHHFNLRRLKADDAG